MAYFQRNQSEKDKSNETGEKEKLSFHLPLQRIFMLLIYARFSNSKIFSPDFKEELLRLYPEEEKIFAHYYSKKEYSTNSSSCKKKLLLAFCQECCMKPILRTIGFIQEIEAGA